MEERERCYSFILSRTPHETTTTGGKIDEVCIFCQTVELTNITPALTAVQTVTPVRDFFSAQQLVSVSAAGLYTVAVEAAFVDEKGELWNTGPRTSIVIKVSWDFGSRLKCFNNLTVPV
jgi:hypothetical protein